MPDNKRKKRKLVRWETIKTIFEESVEVRNKTITVSAKMQKPVYLNDDMTEHMGWEVISLFIARGDKMIIYPFREAEAIHKLLGEGLLSALADHSKCETAFQAWREKKDASSYKSGGVRHTGKTERKKAAGKAGEDYHRKKKRERAEKDRQIARDMGAGKKKGG
jgi:hypothetical protein